MIIKDITARNISIPLARPIKNPAFTFHECKFTLVNITTEEGIEGWSYVFGMPHTRAVVEELREILIGETVETRRLWQKMLESRVVRWDRGGIAYRALSAIDIALWDISGKYCSLPVYQMLGAYRAEAMAYYTGGHYPTSYTHNSELLDYLEKDFGKGLAQGFNAFKMKIGRASPAVDLERIKFCRELIGPERLLMVDAFCAYDAETIIPLAKKFEKYDIFWLEEPVTLDDIPNCAYVAANVPMPVALGESHYTLAQFRDIINNKAGRILMPDITYIGGFTGMIHFAGIAAYFGLKLSPHWCHDLSVQAALAIPEVIGLEYTDANSPLFLIHKVIKNPVIAHNGFVRAPEGPGHGLILDEEAVAGYLDN